jgi:alpha-1,2-mannosyltransferase
MPAQRDEGPTGAPRAWLPRARVDWLLLIGIMAIAFLVRALPVLRGGGLDGHLGYDDGVYFGAAVALIHGDLPYRDFLLLHPPGIALLLSPFAWLAGLTDDATGFAVARLAFMALGAVNACLVAVLAGRYGRRAGLLSGLLYAVWFAAARVERTTDLLGPQTTLMLVAALILVSARPVRARRAAVAGAALGLATAIQLWAVVPVVVIAATIAIAARRAPTDGRRAAPAFLVGAAVAFGAVCLPFFLSAPADFIRLVLVDQLARPSLGVSLLARFQALEGLSIGTGHSPALVTAAVTAFALIGVSAVFLVARRVPAARLWCALVVLQTSYLLIAPNFYSHYSAWIAPAAAIVLGTAAALAIETGQRYRVGTLVYAGCIAVAVALALGIPRHQGVALQQARLELDLDGARCVSADAPDLLLVTTGLRRDIANRCRLVLDPTGTSYETDRGHLATGPVGHSRLGAPGYQLAMEEYYDDSNAAMFTRKGADGLTAGTQEEISDELPIVVDRGTVTVMLPGTTTLP